MNIATLSNRLTMKISKAELSAMLSDVYSSMGLDNASTDEQRKLADVLAYAYKMLAPPMVASKAVSDDFTWVLQAVAKKDVREYLRYVYCDGPRLIATDGHRLHIAPNSYGLEPGLYDKQKNKVDLGWAYHYPQVDRVIPGLDGMVFVRGESLKDLTVKQVGKYEAYQITQGGSSAYFNKKYLSQACPAGVASYYYKELRGGIDPCHSLRVEDGERLAVIMPMRV